MKNFVISICIFLALMVSVNGQVKDKYPYPAVGQISNPKVNIHWNEYHDYEEITDIMKALVKAHPNICKLESIGKSYEGKDIWVMTVCDFSAGPIEDRAAYWIDGGIHANELQASEVVLYTLWYLLEMSEHNEFIASLLRDRVFYLLPVFYPDSRNAHFHQANSTHTPRTGMRPVDDDRDGLINEDGFDDIDGDGHIAMMRIKDPRGQYKKDQKYPQRMARVKKGEKGDYRLLGYEGIDNDGDGRVNEDGDGSYDPNRNFAWGWRSNYIQWGASFYPFSNKENRAVAEYIMKRPNIAGLQTYHNTAGMLLIGPGDKDRPYEAADNRLLEEMSQFGRTLLPGYKHAVIHKDLYPAYGTEVDWAYGMLGITAYNNELFTTYNYFHQKSEGWFGTDEEKFKFNKHILFGDGWIKWKPFDHPQYGKIEIGGYKKTWGRQPPGFMLQEECHRNMAFSLYHADQLPKVQISDVEVKQQSKGLYLITATAINDKLIPTHLAVDLKHNITPADVFHISGDQLKVIYGLTSNDPFFKRPHEKKYQPEKLKISSINGGGTVYARWLIKAKGTIKLKIKSIKGGVDTKEINLMESTL